MTTVSDKATNARRRPRQATYLVQERLCCQGETLLSDNQASVFIPEVRAGAPTIERLTMAHFEEHTTLEHGWTSADDLLALTRMQTYEGGPVKVHPWLAARTRGVRHHRARLCHGACPSPSFCRRSSGAAAAAWDSASLLRKLLTRRPWRRSPLVTPNASGGRWSAKPRLLRPQSAGAAACFLLRTLHMRVSGPTSNPTVFERSLADSLKRSPSV